MVTRNELFKSRFMNASNVDRPIVATIAFAKMETLENTKGETDTKLVVYFSDHKQNLALNGVNFDAICEISGEDDSDRWADTRIEIFRTTTEVAGKATPCVRVRAPQTEMALKPAAKPAPNSATSPKPKKPLKDEMGDEIPW